MSIEQLKAALPEYARDIKLNLSSLATDETLNPQQLWGCFLVSALASRNATVTAAIAAEAAPHLSEAAMTAAKAAASIMAMNNIYYRFVHLSSNTSYKTMPAKLRMNVLANPGVEKTDFELWSLAASAVNGCGMCIDSHERHLLAHGMTDAQTQTAIRIAAVVHAVACVLEGETALSGTASLSAAA